MDIETSKGTPTSQHLNLSNARLDLALFIPYGRELNTILLHSAMKLQKPLDLPKLLYLNYVSLRQKHAKSSELICIHPLQMVSLAFIICECR
jgi:hypothetical protein